MKDFGLLAMSAALLALGFVSAWQLQDLRALELQAVTSIIASDNAEFRQVTRTLRQRCPTQPRYQPAPLIKGLPV